MVGKFKESGASSEERDWVLGVEVDAQVYTASIMAITAGTPQEKACLNQLASRLGLQPEARSYIDKSLGMPAEG